MQKWEDPGREVLATDQQREVEGRELPHQCIVLMKVALINSERKLIVSYDVNRSLLMQLFVGK